MKNRKKSRSIYRYVQNGRWRIWCIRSITLHHSTFYRVYIYIYRIYTVWSGSLYLSVNVFHHSTHQNLNRLFSPEILLFCLFVKIYLFSFIAFHLSVSGQSNILTANRKMWFKQTFISNNCLLNWTEIYQKKKNTFTPSNWQFLFHLNQTFHLFESKLTYTQNNHYWFELNFCLVEKKCFIHHIIIEWSILVDLFVQFVKTHTNTRTRTRTQSISKTDSPILFYL